MSGNVVHAANFKERDCWHRNLLESLVDGYALFQLMLDQRGDCYDLKYLEVNSAYEKMVSFSRKIIEGSTLLDLFPSTDKSLITTYVRVATTGRPERLEYRKKYFNKYIEMAISRPEPGLVSVFYTDVTKRRITSDRLNRLAYHDMLTGLPNRLALYSHLTSAIARAKRHRSKIALLFIDLDGFKSVNDDLGHTCGDSLLKTVAKSIQASVRGEDMAARLGGDEFTVVLEEISVAEDAARAAMKILEAINHPVSLDEQTTTPSASVGISIYPDNASCVNSLMKTADVAMYRAKEKGKNQFQFFNTLFKSDE